MLRRLSRDAIYDDGAGMAPGGLLLAEMLADELSLRVGAGLGHRLRPRPVVGVPGFALPRTGRLRRSAGSTRRRGSAERPQRRRASVGHRLYRVTSDAACRSKPAAWTPSSACSPSTASARGPGCCAISSRCSNQVAESVSHKVASGTRSKSCRHSSLTQTAGTPSTKSTIRRFGGEITLRRTRRSTSPLPVRCATATSCGRTTSCIDASVHGGRATISALGVAHTPDHRRPHRGAPADPLHGRRHQARASTVIEVPPSVGRIRPRRSSIDYCVPCTGPLACAHVLDMARNSQSAFVGNTAYRCGQSSSATPARSVTPHWRTP